MKRLFLLLSLLLLSGTATAQRLPYPRMTTAEVYADTVSAKKLGRELQGPRYGSLAALVADLSAYYPAGRLAPGTAALAGHLTIPAGRTLRFEPGARVQLGNYNLTISGRIEAGRHQIFVQNGTGRVTFASTAGVDVLYPEWWGAVADGVTDDAAALNAAAGAAKTATSIPISLAPSRTYVADTTIWLGTATVGEETKYINGNNATILCKVAGAPCLDFTGSHVKGLRDLIVQGDETQTPTCGLLFARISTGQSAAKTTIDRLTTTGYFSKYALCNGASEVMRITNSDLIAQGNSTVSPEGVLLFTADLPPGIRSYHATVEDTSNSTNDLWLWGTKLDYRPDSLSLIRGHLARAYDDTVSYIAFSEPLTRALVRGQILFVRAAESDSAALQLYHVRANAGVGADSVRVWDVITKADSGAAVYLQAAVLDIGGGRGVEVLASEFNNNGSSEEHLEIPTVRVRNSLRGQQPDNISVAGSLFHSEHWAPLYVGPGQIERVFYERNRVAGAIWGAEIVGHPSVTVRNSRFLDLKGGFDLSRGNGDLMGLSEVAGVGPISIARYFTGVIKTSDSTEVTFGRSEAGYQSGYIMTVDTSRASSITGAGLLTGALYALGPKPTHLGEMRFTGELGPLSQGLTGSGCNGGGTGACLNFSSLTKEVIPARAGSIVGWTINLMDGAAMTGGTVTVRVYKNGSQIISTQQLSTTHAATRSFAYAPGTHTYAAGDRLKITVVISGDATWSGASTGIQSSLLLAPVQ